MRIGIDARILAYPKCGISTYVYNLVRNLLKINKDLKIFLFSDSEFDIQYDFSFLPIQKVVFATRKKEKKKWAQRFLPYKLKEYKIDVYHATWNNSVPFLRSCPCVLTIHDLAPWVLGGHFKNKRKEIRYKLRQFFCAQWADVIITVSYRSKQDIIKLCKVKENKVKVIYLGLDEEFKSRVDEKISKEVLNKYNLLNKRYLINPVGIDHPRRNSLLVLRGFHEFLKISNQDFYLVYTGNFYKDGKEYKNLIEKIRMRGLENRVIVTGWVPTQDLKVLLSYATISVIPSLYEGFGLPILESFACRVPVIATKRGAIPEVAQDAAVLIEPTDYKNLASQIRMLIEDEGRRKYYVTKGRERLGLFDWRKAAEETLKIYKQLLK